MSGRYDLYIHAFSNKHERQNIETLTRERSCYELSVHILETISLQHSGVPNITLYSLSTFIRKYLHYIAIKKS